MRIPRAVFAFLVVGLSGCHCDQGLTAVTGDLHVSPTALDFGVLQPGQVRSMSLHFENVGTVTVTVEAQPLTVPFEVEAPGFPFGLAGSASTIVQLTARAAAPGSYAATLHVTSEAGALDVPLQVLVTEEDPLDAGRDDAGPEDAGAGDAGAEDAGDDDAGLDAGAEDAGAEDAGAEDAGAEDAGLDAGADAGLPTADAGVDGALLDGRLHLALARQATLIRTADGGVAWWGRLTIGRSASGLPIQRFSRLPQPLEPLQDVAELAAGADHLCARFLDGGVSCLGSPVPLGATPPASTAYDGGLRPISPVPGHVSALASSGWGTCALTDAADVYCWGAAPLTGGVNSEVPVRVQGLPPAVRALSASLNDVCALTTAGALWCWGFTGQVEALGFGTPPDGGDWFFEPREVWGLDAGLASVALEDDHACGVTFDGGVLCWGRNGCGQLGNGQQGSSSFTQGPQRVPLGLAASSVTVRPSSSCALLDDGTVRCWGCSQPGDGTLGGPAIVTPALGRIRELQASPFATHTCAASDAGAVWCWGNNLDGQLGRATGALTNQNPTPAPVDGL